MNHRYVIGIDGSFRKNGLAMAVYDRAKNAVKTCLFKDIRSFQKHFDLNISEWPDAKDTVVVVEDTTAEVVYPNKVIEWAKRNNLPYTSAVRDRYAISVGKNIAATRYVHDLLRERYGKQVKMRRATEKKLTANFVQMAFKINLRPDISQDEIDAARMALTF